MLRQTAATIRYYRQLCATQIIRFAAWSAQLIRRSLTLAHRCALRMLQDFRTGLRALQLFVSNLWVIFQEIPQWLWSSMRATYQLLLRAGYQFINAISPVIHWMARTTLSALSHIVGFIVGFCAAVLDVIVDSMRFLGHLVTRTPAAANNTTKSRTVASPVIPNNKAGHKPATKPITPTYRQARSHQPQKTAQQAPKRRQRPAH